MVTVNIARTDDGTIQLNFGVPQTDIDKAQVTALTDLAKDVTVAGFRKGKAPIDKVKDKVDAGKLLEKTLGMILPDAYMKAIKDNNIKPITYPKFEIMKQGDVWEIQAKTAELPIVDLPDYKDLVAGAIRAASLKKDLTKQDKEEVVITTLIGSIKVKVPRLIIDEEVNARLSELLARTERLGLKLEQYLASIGKNEKIIREEYEKQVTDGISLELILNKIADAEKTEVPEKEVEEAIKTTGVTETHEGHIEEQKQLIRSVLKRRIVLDQLTNLK
jgi:FKBP-type peptidyl-prolyl cis-trans isomerase (trigger factor)